MKLMQDDADDGDVQDAYITSDGDDANSKKKVIELKLHVKNRSSPGNVLKFPALREMRECSICMNLPTTMRLMQDDADDGGAQDA